MSEDSSHLGHRQRLRQRFLETRGQGMPDYELLELILFGAKPRGDVKPLAKKLLKQFGSFDAVLAAEDAELRSVDGVGDAVVSTLKAIHVAAERMLSAPARQRPVIQNWTALLDYCRLKMGKLKTEEFHILFLNHKHILIKDEVQQRGTVNHTPIYPREVIKRALELGSTSIILVHNHPSGDPTPSKADIDMTRKIIEAASPMSIAVHDHLIIAEKGHYSFKSHGII